MRANRALALWSSLALACATQADTEIFEAVGSQDHGLTLELVEAGVELEARDEHDSTPLMLAVFSNNLDGTRILLEHGADANARRSTEPSGSAIFFAQEPEMIDLLLHHGADLELRSRHGQTVLWWNAALGNVRIVRHLVAAGADVNARDNHGMTPLGVALLNREQRPPEEVQALAELLRDAGAE